MKAASAASSAESPGRTRNSSDCPSARIQSSAASRSAGVQPGATVVALTRWPPSRPRRSASRIRYTNKSPQKTTPIPKIAKRAPKAREVPAWPGFQPRSVKCPPASGEALVSWATAPLATPRKSTAASTHPFPRPPVTGWGFLCSAPLPIIAEPSL